VRAEKRDYDIFDPVSDHLCVVDLEKLGVDGRNLVVGTYRLLRGEVAALYNGYYSRSEFDLAPMLRGKKRKKRFLEVGRSCVRKEYRTNGHVVKLMWKGIANYLARYEIDVMFGCGSLPGTDPQKLAEPLSYLHHFHLAPKDVRVRARADRYVAMNILEKDEIASEERRIFRSLPPLMKGYLRFWNAYVGDGAVVDFDFGTTDVFLYVPVEGIDKRMADWINS
jgi:putative hemolysin